MSDRVERHTSPGFVVVGVVMIVVAALAGLADAVAVTFAVLGAGLVVLGGITSRLAPGERQEFGPAGLKFVLADLKKVAEQENRPEEAKVLGELVETADDWYQNYLRMREQQPRDPLSQAALLQEAWRGQLREPGALSEDDVQSLTGVTVDRAEIREAPSGGRYLGSISGAGAS